jgi:hypothetical protein
MIGTEAIKIAIDSKTYNLFCEPGLESGKVHRKFRLDSKV